jgi:hypothetical protein
VRIEYTNEGEKLTLVSHDRPLPEFVQSVEALVPLVINTLGLPKTYAGKKPTEGDKEPGNPLTPTGITIVTKGDSRQVLITATKVLSATPSPLNLTVPLRYMDAPTEEGATSEPYSAKEVELLEDVIQHAKDYLTGKRAQGSLPLDDEPPGYEPQEETLDFPVKK